MNQNLDSASVRFDTALFIMGRNLGPQLVPHAQFDLTPGQLWMLYLIQHENQRTVTKLAQKMGVNPSAISVMLDRLENRGLLHRTRDEVDRRVVNVHLAETGTQALRDVIRLRRGIIQRCLGQLHPDELNDFLTTLEKLAEISEAIDLKSTGSPKPLEG